jgi:hypothetical protein
VVDFTVEDLAIENASSTIKVEGLGIRNGLSRRPDGEWLSVEIFFERFIQSHVHCVRLTSNSDFTQFISRTSISWRRSVFSYLEAHSKLWSTISRS